MKNPLRRSRAILLPLVIASFLGVFWLGACTRKESAPETQGQTLALKIGVPMFAFDPDQTGELMIAKTDPQTGNRWTARLAQQKDRSWEITSAPEGKVLIDRRGDGKFVMHLLDTLRSLRPSAMAPEGPLESFGLKPPFHALQWSQVDTQPARVFEVHFGHAAPGEEGLYALAPGNPVISAHGATLQMLEYLNSFDVLRQRVWITFETDESDEWELKRSGKTTVQAERQGTDWVSLKTKKKLRAPVETIFDRLSHTRIKAFIDDATENSRAMERVRAKPDYQLIFKDRRGNPTELKVATFDGKLFGWISTRADAAFELHPESLNIFTQLGK